MAEQIPPALQQLANKTIHPLVHYYHLVNAIEAVKQGRPVPEFAKETVKSYLEHLKIMIQQEFKLYHPLDFQIEMASDVELIQYVLRPALLGQPALVFVPVVNYLYNSHPVSYAATLEPGQSRFFFYEPPYFCNDEERIVLPNDQLIGTWEYMVEFPVEDGPQVVGHRRCFAFTEPAEDGPRLVFDDRSSVVIQSNRPAYRLDEYRCEPMENDDRRLLRIYKLDFSCSRI